ncbi:MAG: hypothetical protein ABI830_06050, partial [Pseudolabrys sp.]
LLKNNCTLQMSLCLGGIMSIANFRCRLAIAIVSIAGLCAPPANAADTPAACDTAFSGDAAPIVSNAYNYTAYQANLPKNGPATLTEADKNTAVNAAKTVALGNIVAIEGANLGKLFAGECAKKTVVLFLNKSPMKGLVRNPPSNPNDKDTPLYFTLTRTSEAREAWTSILGSPLTKDHNVDVSIGFDDGFALKSTDQNATKLIFDVVPTGWFRGWAVLVVSMLGLFVWFAAYSNIIRDPSPVLDNTLGTFSLSRLQGAWWFFVIIAAYIFIGVITGDFSNSVNSTALILLGIGAGTVIGSAAIDAQKDTDEQRANTTAAITKIQAQIKAIDAAFPPPVDLSKLKPEDAAQVAAKARLKSQLRKLQGQSEGIFKDILSDANGISFHRFQIAVWTLVLSIVFAIGVYETLAMPEFNTTLMGLMGLSAGTYLGLKIPEPTTPSKPPLGK